MKIIFCLTLLLPLALFAELVERIVAIVNNEIITQTDLNTFSKKLDKNGFLDDLLLFGSDAKRLSKNKDAQLDYLINEKVLESEIKRLNLSVTIERVEQEIKEIAKRNGLSRNDLLSTIKQQGVGAAEYQAFIKTKVERQSLVESEITSKIRVSDDDVLAEYSHLHPNLTSGVYEYTLSHIFFNPKKGGSDLALSKANLVLKKIRAGEAFEVLAEQHSEDPNFAAGGALGIFKAGEFAKELETAVAPLNPGETTDVVKAKIGYHIIKLISKKLVADPQFEKEKEKIRATLFEKLFQKHFKNWLNSKKEDSFIRINK